MNFHSLIGNAGNDAESRDVGNSRFVVSFSLAYSYGKDKPTTWFRVQVWGDEKRRFAADLARAVKKGDQVMVAGRTELRQYEAGGEKKQSLEITADEVRILARTQRGEDAKTNQDSKKEKAHGSSSNTSGSHDQQSEPADDDVPF